MEVLHSVWMFFQDQVLGMKWLNALIGKGLIALGLDRNSILGKGHQFFIYDTIKIFVLLSVLIYIIFYIQSYFPPERTKKILGRSHGIGVNSIEALLGNDGNINLAYDLPYDDASQFSEYKKCWENTKGLFVIRVTNWLIKPFTMYGIVSLFFFVIFKPFITLMLLLLRIANKTKGWFGE